MLGRNMKPSKNLIFVALETNTMSIVPRLTLSSVLCLEQLVTSVGFRKYYCQASVILDMSAADVSVTQPHFTVLTSSHICSSFVWMTMTMPTMRMVITMKMMIMMMITVTMTIVSDTHAVCLQPPREKLGQSRAAIQESDKYKRYCAGYHS